MAQQGIEDNPSSSTFVQPFRNISEEIMGYRQNNERLYYASQNFDIPTRDYTPEPPTHASPHIFHNYATPTNNTSWIDEQLYNLNFGNPFINPGNIASSSRNQPSPVPMQSFGSFFDNTAQYNESGAVDLGQERQFDDQGGDQQNVWARQRRQRRPPRCGTGGHRQAIGCGYLSRMSMNVTGYISLSNNITL